MTELDRRTVLTAACVGCAGLALAACSNDVPTDASKGAPTAQDTGLAPPSQSSEAAQVPLEQLAAIPVGEAISVKSPEGAKLLLARPTPTTAVAFSAICTHQGCTVAPDGKQLACPCHGSVFEATTGKVVNGPARSALHPVAVTVRGGSVFLA